jgi:hypothetical protein
MQPTSPVEFPRLPKRDAHSSEALRLTDGRLRWTLRIFLTSAARWPLLQGHPEGSAEQLLTLWPLKVQRS